MSHDSAPIGEPTAGQLAEMIRRHVDADRGWHLKREIQLGHIITTVAMAVSVIWYAGKVEQRVALAEQQIAQMALVQRDRDERQDRVAAEAVSVLLQRIDRLEAKIDRLIEARQR